MDLASRRPRSLKKWPTSGPSCRRTWDFHWNRVSFQVARLKKRLAEAELSLGRKSRAQISGSAPATISNLATCRDCIHWIRETYKKMWTVVARGKHASQAENRSSRPQVSVKRCRRRGECILERLGKIAIRPFLQISRVQQSLVAAGSAMAKRRSVAEHLVNR